MINKRTKLAFCAFLSIDILSGGLFAGPTSLGSAITYQGQLKKDGHLADGTYDFRFALYDAKVGGLQVGMGAN